VFDDRERGRFERCWRGAARRVTKTKARVAAWVIEQQKPWWFGLK